MNTREKIAYVFQYATIFISSTGILTNLLAFGVFQMSSKFKKLPFTIFFKILLACDTIILLHSFRQFFDFVLDLSIEDTSNLACKLAEYSIYVFDSISTWTFGVILVERLVAIVFPSHRHVFASKRNKIAMILSIIIYSSLLYVTMPFFRFLKFTDSSNSSSTNSTTLRCEYSGRTQALIVYLSDFMNITFSTFIFNNTITIVTLVRIFKSRKRTATAFINNDNNPLNKQQLRRTSRNSVRDRKFAINSIIMNFVFLGCEMPVISIQVMAIYVNDESSMLYVIGFFVFSLKCSSCFWINLCVNSIFRYEFLLLIYSRGIFQKYQHRNQKATQEITSSKIAK